MNSKQCLNALSELAQLPDALFIFGGVAEDLLLNGNVVEDHGDIDIYVLRKDLSIAKESLRQLGFGEFETYFEEVEGHPLVIATDKGTSHLELGIFDQDEAGDIYFELQGDSSQPHRIYLPQGALDYPPINLDANKVHVLSPLALYHMRAGLEVTKSFGELRPKDVKAQASLRAKFFTKTSPVILKPRVDAVKIKE